MAIVNRTLDPSQQNETFTVRAQSVNTGATALLIPIETPATVKALVVNALGVSGTPVYDARLFRFASGGLTSWPLSATTFGARLYGTSGALSVSLFGSASLVSAQASDYIGVVATGANSAVDVLTVSVVIQALQDVKTSFGV